MKKQEKITTLEFYEGFALCFEQFYIDKILIACNVVVLLNKYYLHLTHYLIHTAVLYCFWQHSSLLIISAFNDWGIRSFARMLP